MREIGHDPATQIPPGCPFGLDPEYGPAHRALAEHYERTGQRELAEQHRRHLQPK
jgi:hypothetical protein